MHSVAEIEEKIRQHYHQPKGVEQFGIEPVPPRRRRCDGTTYSRLFSGSRSIPARCWSAAWPWFRVCRSGARLVRSPQECCSPLPTTMATVGVDYGIARPSLDAHGLRPARRQMGALLSAHDRIDLLVRISDRGGLARGRRNPRSVDREHTRWSRSASFSPFCRRSSRSSAMIP